MISTKEKILLEALTLFSKNSYDAITVNQIAQIVGIKAIAIGKTLILSPSFPPLHTVHAPFNAHGVPSSSFKS